MARGSKPAPALPMNDYYYTLLDKERNKPSCTLKRHARLSIIVFGSEGRANKQVARTVGVGLKVVKAWRNRWLLSYDTLIAFEAELSDDLSLSKKDKIMLDKLLEVISDRPRSGTPAKISQAQRQAIVALACKCPSDFGIEQTDWTYPLLAKVAIEKKIVDTISPAHLGRLLKKKCPSTP